MPEECVEEFDSDSESDVISPEWERIEDEDENIEDIVDEEQIAAAGLFVV